MLPLIVNALYPVPALITVVFLMALLILIYISIVYVNRLHEAEINIKKSGGKAVIGQGMRRHTDKKKRN